MEQFRETYEHRMRFRHVASRIRRTLTLSRTAEIERYAADAMRAFGFHRNRVTARGRLVTSSLFFGRRNRLGRTSRDTRKEHSNQ
jgi:hypothetical protein